MHSDLTPAQRYYQKNRERILAQKKQEYEENKDAKRQYINERYHTDPEVRKSFWARNLRRKFGITVEQYEEMLEAQEGGCAICGTTDCQAKTGKSRLAVDHDHDTGKVRGLLCNHCNAGLGAFRDNTTLLEKAIKYLEEHG